MEKYYLKLTSYLISLLPLSFILLIKAYDKILNLRTNDRVFWFFLIGGILYIIMVGVGVALWYAKKRGTKFPVLITNIRNNNTEQILYLMTYIIPLTSIDYDRITLLQLTGSLILMGFMYCKTNLFFANPFLSLLGRNVYRAHVQNPQINEDAIIMTKKSIKTIGSQSHQGLYVVDEEVILVI